MTPTDIPADLYTLAPRALPPPRSAGFDGTGFAVPSAAFSQADWAALREVYASVNGLAERWRAGLDGLDWVALRGHLLAVERDRLTAAARGLGREPRPDPRVPKLLHDIRGGGLAALLGMAELVEAGVGGAELVRFCYAAARDHAKIMRSWVVSQFGGTGVPPVMAQTGGTPVPPN